MTSNDDVKSWIQMNSYEDVKRAPQDRQRWCIASLPFTKEDDRSWWWWLWHLDLHYMYVKEQPPLHNSMNN